jgi:hypothetical protein
VRQRLGQDTGLIERTDVRRVGHESGSRGQKDGAGSIRLPGTAQSMTAMLSLPLPKGERSPDAAP